MPGRARALLVALLIVAGTALARQQVQERELLREGRIVVLSDVALETSVTRSVLARVLAADAFVASELAWTDRKALERPVRVRALGVPAFKALSKNASGLALGADTIATTASFLLLEERSTRTLAHELTHLQDRRQLLRVKTRLPHWLSEGRAVAMGRAYVAFHRIDDARYDQNLARALAKIDRAEAKRILEDEAFIPEKKMKSVFRMEALGFLFVERVRLQFPDASVRLARVVAAIGKGASLDAAFADELGPFAETKARFLDFIERTQQDPGARLRGTALAAYVPEPKAPPPPSEGDDHDADEPF